MRKAADIQFSPIEAKPKPPPELPAWLKAIGDFLESLLRPLGEALGLSWPVLQWVLVGIAVLCVGLLVWRIIAPLLEGRLPRPAAAEVPEWMPDRGAVMALLEDADRLAAEGRFDEATHLLLQRSIGEIAEARPDWLHPATTAREIAGNAALPERARAAFATIAARVERSFFALIPLGAEDWQAARAAYADFALGGIRT
ncbi:hypothetical protein C0V78_10680 [Novosphingobium sp. TH158]|nr:hypothetical protein C0V78_10680 [Novosphingobium sp. TH158]